VKFAAYNNKTFPYIYKLVCCLASLRTNEVGCERFFSIAGYVSNPRRSSLKVHHYESIAMLKRNMQQVYIDEDWVVKQFVMKEKDKDWSETDRRSDEMVAALEQELYASDLGVTLEAEVEQVEGEEAAMAADPITVDESSSDTDSDSEIVYLDKA
jgi:hAT family C-terminal dimerisation region